jgi:hypothetical protein
MPSYDSGWTPPAGGHCCVPWSRVTLGPAQRLQGAYDPSREALERRVRTERSDELEQASIDALDNTA